MLKRFRALGLTLGLLGLAPLAVADQFPDPNQPIKIVVPYTAGGSSDFVARTLATKLGLVMKQSVVVENKPGGSTIVGGDFVARSKPDGHTLFLIGELTNGALPALNKNLPYDPMTAFAGITNLVESPLVIVVPTDFPAKTLKEFVAYAKANPGKINYGSAGQGNTLHLAGAKFAASTNIDMTHVPYKGASQALIDLVGGRIQVMFDLPQTPLPQIKDGRLRALAVTSKRRLDFLPDVPTVAEAGFPNYEFTTRIGIAAPAKTPDGVRLRLEADIKKVLADPDVAKAFAEKAMYVSNTVSPTAYDRDLRLAVDAVTKLLRDAGVQPQ